MAHDEKKCRHEECHCTGDDVRSDGFCSDSCKQGRMEGGKCACGHPDCR